MEAEGRSVGRPPPPARKNSCSLHIVSFLLQKILALAHKNNMKTQGPKGLYHVLTVAGSSRDSFTVARYDADAKSWKSGVGSGSKLLDSAMDKPLPWQVVKAKFLLDYPAFFVQGSTDFPSKIAMTLAKIQKSVDNAVVLFDQGRVLDQGADT